MNEINYDVQAQYVNPTERLLKIKLEEQKEVNRYLLNLKKEIGTQIRLLKPNSIMEAQTHSTETEMCFKNVNLQESKQSYDIY